MSVNEETTAISDDEVAVSSAKSLNPFSIVKKITVEPLIVVTMVTIITYSMISNQYIYYRLSKDYGVENSTKASACVSSNETDAIKKLQEKVVAESNNWVLYINIAGFIPSFFCTVLMGSWGDTVGRRPPLICSFIGYIGMTTLCLVIISFELPIVYLLVAKLVAGISGDYAAILCSCFAYLADISSHKDRTIRVAIGEAGTGVGGIIASLLSGIWISAQGFVPPLWMLFAVSLSSIFYIIFVLPESHITPLNSSLSTCNKIRALGSCRHFVAVWEMLSGNWDRAFKVLGVLLCFFLQLCVFAGIGETITIYELSKPLCWTPDLIGYGSSIRMSAYLVGVLTLKGFSGILNDFYLVLLGTVSLLCSLTVFAFAKVTWMMFLGFGVGVLCTISIPVIRSMISRLVSSDEQGSAFALIACAEATASLVASFIFNGVYSATVGTFPGMFFLIGDGMQILFLIVFSFVYMKTKSYFARIQYYEQLNYEDIAK